MVIEVLKDTLSKTNDWVKFAEAKNAANIAFCSAGIFALTRLMTSAEPINTYLLYYIFLVLLCLTLALAISLFSFMPKLKAPWLHIDSRSESDNLLYFGHACKYSATAYLQKLYSGKPEKSKNYTLELSYSDQIVINSKVAFIKFKQFDIAIWLTISALLSPLGAVAAAHIRR